MDSQCTFTVAAPRESSFSGVLFSIGLTTFIAVGTFIAI